jgi:hypothetical protein
VRLGASLLRQARRAVPAIAVCGIAAFALLGVLAAPARAANPDPSPAGSGPPQPDAYGTARSTAVARPAAQTSVPAAVAPTFTAPAAAPVRIEPVTRPRVIHRSRPKATGHAAKKHRVAVHEKKRVTPKPHSTLLPFADLVAPARAAAAAPLVAARSERKVVSVALALAVAGVVLCSGLLVAGVAREVHE